MSIKKCFVGQYGRLALEKKRYKFNLPETHMCRLLTSRHFCSPKISAGVFSVYIQDLILLKITFFIFKNKIL